MSKRIQFPLTTTKQIDITITKKRMKNMRLSISKTGVVAVSIPYNTTYSYAYQFLIRKRVWINSQLDKINLNIAKNSCNFTNNGNIFILGNNYPLQVELGLKNKVVFNNSNLAQQEPNSTNFTARYGFTIYAKDINSEFVRLIFIKWCKKYFLDFFANRLNHLHSQIFTNSTAPEIKIKTMKSMWGNCNFVKRIITLNIYLAKTPLECIDYVMVHELAHLVHHNHSKEFHNLMTKLLPDWKTRKKLLNNYSLQF